MKASRIKIDIECINAAFEGRSGMPEVKRITAEALKMVPEITNQAIHLGEPVSRTLLDVNGNKVGTVEVTA